MGLLEIKQSIEQSSRKYLEGERQAALKASNDMIISAKKSCDETLRTARETARITAARMLAETNAEIEVEIASILSSAKEELISKNLPHMRNEAIKQLSSKHEKELVSKAVSSFSSIADKAASTIESNKKNLESLTGFGNKVTSKNMVGVLMYTNDGSISLNAQPSEIVDSELERLRNIMMHIVFGD